MKWYEMSYKHDWSRMIYIPAHVSCVEGMLHRNDEGACLWVPSSHMALLVSSRNGGIPFVKDPWAWEHDSKKKVPNTEKYPRISISSLVGEPLQFFVQIKLKFPYLLLQADFSFTEHPIFHVWIVLGSSRFPAPRFRCAAETWSTGKSYPIEI